MRVGEHRHTNSAVYDHQVDLGCQVFKVNSKFSVSLLKNE